MDAIKLGDIVAHVTTGRTVGFVTHIYTGLEGIKYVWVRDAAGKRKFAIDSLVLENDPRAIKARSERAQ